MTHSAKRGAGLALTATLLLAPAAGLGQASAPSHCTADEEIFFSCKAGAKTVSLCAARRGGAIASLSYRYGQPHRIEMEYSATPANQRHFYGNVAPLNPHASVSQTWFDLGETRYLVSNCTGSGCPYEAGLSVVRGQRLLLNRPCTEDENSHPWFDEDIVDFGSSTRSSVSKTGLVILSEQDNDLEKLFPPSARTSRERLRR